MTRAYPQPLRAGVALALVIGLVMLAALGPALAPHDPVAVSTDIAGLPPSLRNWLGTDDLGRDVLSRVLWGARVSLSVALTAVCIGVLGGVALGLLAASTTSGIDRTVDGLLAFPPLLLAIALTSALGPEPRNAMVAIGLAAMPMYTRLVRAVTLQTRAQDFVCAARSLGATMPHIVLRHLLPALTGTLLVHATVSAAAALLTESTLAYLGIGAQPPLPSWGQDVSYSQRHLTNNQWWMTAGPAAAIFVSVLAFHLLGDALRDARDPFARKFGSRNAARARVGPYAQNPSTDSRTVA